MSLPSPPLGIVPASPVIVYLHSPKERLWGLLLDIPVAGVFLRGIDLNSFEDWMRMVVRGERDIGLTHIFLPMWRVERVALDETIGEIPSLADRFSAAVGLTIHEYLGGS